MRNSLLIQTVGLALLCTYPAGLCAQTAPPSHQRSAPTSPSLAPRQAEPGADAERASSGLPSMITVVGSLVLVLGVFLFGVWLFRKTTPAGFGVLPIEAFESLGRARLTTRQQVHLLRCGNKVLLVAVGVASAETLTEITDPEEVERLVELCRRPRSGGAAAAFRQVFRREEGHDES